MLTPEERESICATLRKLLFREDYPDVTRNSQFIFNITQAMFERGWTYSISKNIHGSVRVQFLRLDPYYDFGIEHDGPEHEAVAYAAFQLLSEEEALKFTRITEQPLKREEPKAPRPVPICLNTSVPAA